MVSFTCPHCGAEIPEDEHLMISGTATVEGYSSLGGFHDVGVIWTTRDSWDEEAKCTRCGKFFAPDFEKFRAARAEEVKTE